MSLFIQFTGDLVTLQARGVAYLLACWLSMLKHWLLSTPPQGPGVCTSVMPALRRRGREDQKSEFILEYAAKFRSAWVTFSCHPVLKINISNKYKSIISSEHREQQQVEETPSSVRGLIVTEQ